MRVTTRFAAIALWACCLAALPSRADDNPWAHLEGFRCEVLRDGETPPGMPVSTIVVCQIDDEPNPFSLVFSPPSHSTTTSPTHHSLLNLLFTLNNARHEASLPWHDAVVPAPTP